MTGTRGIGRRRGARGYVPIITGTPGKTVLVDGVPVGAIPNPEPAQTATQVIGHPAPAETEVICPPPTDGELEEIAGALADPEPVPCLDSPRAADRTEYFIAIGGDEPTFRAVVADLDAEWLVNTALPAPPRAPETAEDTHKPVPEAPCPPAGEDSGSAPAQSSPEASGTVSSEDEPVQDEPDAEPDCAEGGDV